MISFKNITFCYTKNISLFENLTFEIKKNNFCAILGRSGAGKSSILNLISGIELLNKNFGSAGEICLRNKSINKLDLIFFKITRSKFMLFLMFLIFQRNPG